MYSSRGQYMALLRLGSLQKKSKQALLGIEIVLSLSLAIFLSLIP